MNCSVQDCEKPARAKGMCTMHYQRAKKYGDPLQFDDRTVPLADRIKEKVQIDQSTSCWNWLGFKDSKGYGSLWNGKTMGKAHRLSYQEFVGEIPDGLFVLHRCDNPSCINPEHLFLGTHIENMADMRAKGRSASEKRQRGSVHYQSKLTESQVVEIKTRLAKGEECTAIAKLFDVDRTCISNIKRGINWKHIEGKHHGI